MLMRFLGVFFFNLLIYILETAGYVESFKKLGQATSHYLIVHYLHEIVDHLNASLRTYVLRQCIFKYRAEFYTSF